MVRTRIHLLYLEIITAELSQQRSEILLGKLLFFYCLIVFSSLAVAQSAFDVTNADKDAEAYYELWETATKEQVEAWLKTEPALEAKDDTGKTVFLWASSVNNPEAILALIKAGTDVHARDNYNDTPLTKVAYDGSLEVIRALLQAGADVNARDQRGETALMDVVIYQNMTVISTLLGAGADINIKADIGDTALMLAARGSTDQTTDFEIVTQLLARDATINVQNNKG